MLLTFAGLLAALAVFGSTALWVGLLNRLHGLGIWRPLIHLGTLLSFAMLATGPILCLIGVMALVPSAAALLGPIAPRLTAAASSSAAVGVIVYMAACVVCACGPGRKWVLARMRSHVPHVQLSNHTTTLDLREHTGRPAKWLGRVFSRLPLNEIHHLDVNEKRLAIPDLPAGLEGLSIAHLTDFHFSGRIALDYFREAIIATNALEADLVAVTGDIIDAPECLPWIPEIFGALRAKYGVFYVLGNHDQQVGLELVREAMGKTDLVELSGTCLRMEIEGVPVMIAGTELPWIGEAPSVPHVDEEPETFRLLLSHSPDQIGWARRHGFRMMLAGHTHGGQVRLPLVGATLVPSVYGTRYAAGTFNEPPTVLHVSRGISSLSPLRFNCRPEVALLRLVRAEAEGDREDACDIDATAAAS